jgi:hypothetical protein
VGVTVNGISTHAVTFSDPVGTDPTHKCLLDFIALGVSANRAAVFVTPLASPFLINSTDVGRDAISGLRFAFPLPIGCAHRS